MLELVQEKDVSTSSLIFTYITKERGDKEGTYRKEEKREKKESKDSENKSKTAAPGLANRESHC